MKMNAQKYLDSQLGDVIERMKVACISGKPIILLHTNDLEFVSQLIHSGSIYPDLYPILNPVGPKPKQASSIRYGLRIDFSEHGFSCEDLSQPTLFVLFAREPGSTDRTGMRDFEDELVRFVQLYSGAAIDRGLFAGKQPDRQERLRRIDTVRRSMILIVAAVRPQIPAEIALYTEYITPKPMSDAELRTVLSEEIFALEGVNPHPESPSFGYYEKCMSGLSATRIRQLLRQIETVAGRVSFDRTDSPEFASVREIVLCEKRKLVASSEILSWEDGTNTPATGMDGLTGYLKSIAPIVRDYDRYRRQRLMDFPKGILVSGIPGSGKSLMAKYSASLLGLPLIKMDMGNVLNKYVGGSEQRMTEALNLIGTLSPCVLWIDEIEKAFAGSSDGHETTKRLFGKFLTWMQEKEKKNIGCFVFATANSISSLPSELFRSGRFDAKYSVYMPSAKECGAIFEALIESQCRQFEAMQESDGVEPTLRRRLFDTATMNAALFIGLLNDRKLSLSGFIDNPVEVNRKNKFYTGADIETLIKTAKEKYLEQKFHIDRNGFVYDTTCFERSLRSAIQETKTFGETNLMDLAVCYAAMAVNSFRPASRTFIMPFDGYDETRKDALYSLENEKEHLKELQFDYDRCLYSSVRNLLNSRSEEIIEKRKK